MSPSICNWYSDILYCTMCQLFLLPTWYNYAESLIWLVDDYYKVQLVYLQSTDGKVKGAEGKNWWSNYTAQFLPFIIQFFLTLVPIVWFVAIQTRSMATKMGMNWSLCEYSTSNWCLHCLIGACDKRDNEWSHCIRTRIKHIWDLHSMDDVYHICNKKIRASIPVWCWHEKKDPNLASILVNGR